MLPPNIILLPATNDDGPALASTMTDSFSGSDIAYHLVWGGAEEGTHDKVALFLFTPVIKEYQVTYKAIDVSKDGRIVGFATWRLPRKIEGEKKKGDGGLPPIPGINRDLFDAKQAGSAPAYERDVDEEQDMRIATSLLDQGKKSADKLTAKWWCLSTPQAVKTYEKNGWKVVERHDTDLTKYGGEGLYSRAWMVRYPK
ncbi:hypothetical protein B0O99DRAFT_514093 [Bisporella sp. PMI_857]|nr:hypothetical protein B0O99DRAFT_514093 [Bisporella sp. PMI_857]